VTDLLRHSTVRADARAAEDCNGEAVALLLDGGRHLTAAERGDTVEDAIVREIGLVAAAAFGTPDLAEKQLGLRRIARLVATFGSVDARNDVETAALHGDLDEATTWTRRAAGCLERLRAAFCGRRAGREVA
jgi:hypothetical protein